jgi:excisionase family DNA binding protein
VLTHAIITAMAGRLVTTGEAARELGVTPVTLQRWVHAGLVTPTETTAGGHFRWNIETLREQVRASREQQQ